MKAMKRFFLVISAALCLVLPLSSCDNDESINFSDLPQVTRSFVDAHFKNIGVLQVEKDGDEYDLKLEGGINVEFGRDGNWKKVESTVNGIPQSILDLLPSKILTYLNQNFPGSKVEQIENGLNYEIELLGRPGIELIFSKQGDIIRVDRDDNNQYIPVSNLPQISQTFVSTHFKDLTVLYAEKDDDGEYEVKFEGGTNVEFAADGSWKKVESIVNGLPQSVLNLVPAKIMTYVNANYPNKKVEQIENGIYYEVELIGVPDVELIFNKQGDFIRVDR